MPQHLTFALIAVVILVAVPATASAQAPLDERANAQAFADIGLRLAGEFETATTAMEASREEPPGCLSERRLARRLKRGPERRVAALFDLYGAQVIGDFARAVDPAVARAASDMHAIRTADRGLRGGRTAWRRIHRVYASFAALPAADVCGEARALVRNGFRRTPAMRRAQRTLNAANHTGGIERRLERAVKRLSELGVPAADADLFDGPFSDS
jgi:hypothetical protein